MLAANVNTPFFIARIRKKTMNPEQFLALLNEDLAREYRAALMYRAHAAMLSGLFFAFVDVLYEHADDEMKHARLLAEHINYLGGIPTSIEAQPAVSYENEAMLSDDFTGEKDAINRYRQRIAQAREVLDFGTEAILLSILQDEESHYNDLQSILATDTE